MRRIRAFRGVAEQLGIASAQHGTMAHIGFLVDMDGVIYRGSELIPGAHDFVTRLRHLRIPFSFLATQKPNGTAYVIGEHGLAAALHRNGYTVVDDESDFVVVGEGRTLTYEMIERGVRLVEKGARLIATNLDPNCPTENGIPPGRFAYQPDLVVDNIVMIPDEFIFGRALACA